MIRKPSSFMSSICDERGAELLYAGMPITEVFKVWTLIINTQTYSKGETKNVEFGSVLILKMRHYPMEEVKEEKAARIRPQT